MSLRPWSCTLAGWADWVDDRFPDRTFNTRVGGGRCGGDIHARVRSTPVIVVVRSDRKKTLFTARVLKYTGRLHHLSEAMRGGGGVGKGYRRWCTINIILLLRVQKAYRACRVAAIVRNPSSEAGVASARLYRAHTHVLIFPSSHGRPVDGPREMIPFSFPF